MILKKRSKQDRVEELIAEVRERTGQENPELMVGVGAKLPIFRQYELLILIGTHTIVHA